MTSFPVQPSSLPGLQATLCLWPFGNRISPHSLPGPPQRAMVPLSHEAVALPPIRQLLLFWGE